MEQKWKEQELEDTLNAEQKLVTNLVITVTLYHLVIQPILQYVDSSVPP